MCFLEKVSFGQDFSTVGPFDVKASAEVFIVCVGCTIENHKVINTNQALLDACDIIGLNCLRLMHENTATALAFGIFKSAKDHTRDGCT